MSKRRGKLLIFIQLAHARDQRRQLVGRLSDLQAMISDVSFSFALDHVGEIEFLPIFFAQKIPSPKFVRRWMRSQRAEGLPFFEFRFRRIAGRNV